MSNQPPDIEPLQSTLPDEYTEPVPLFDPRSGDIVGKSPRLTSEQNKKLHALLNQLGHHMDEPKTGKNGAKGEIIKQGKYRKKLREKFCKDHANELSGIEASWVIEWLLKCVEKLESRMERGNPPPAPEASSPVVSQLQGLMELTQQLVANGHRGAEAQMAWASSILGRPVKLGTEMATEEIAKCLAAAQGAA